MKSFHTHNIREQMVKEILDIFDHNPIGWSNDFWNYYADSPVNGKTGALYRGINSLYLTLQQIKKGYDDSRWVTTDEAKDLGTGVRKGEKASPIVFYKQWDYKKNKTFVPTELSELDENAKKKYVEDNIRFVQCCAYVFNAKQCDYFPEREQVFKRMPERERAWRNEIIENIIKNCNVPIVHEGEKAFYSPFYDEIHLPPVESFLTKEDYYATVLHEIAHSTGHRNRLNRSIDKEKIASYAEEELRVELATMFMQREFGVRLDGDHFWKRTHYFDDWLKYARKDMQVMFDIINDAEEISDYVTDNYLNQSDNSVGKESVSDSDLEVDIAITQSEKDKVGDKKMEKDDKFYEKPEVKFEEIPVFDSDAVFSEQVDAAIENRLQRNSDVLVSRDTPFALRMVGFRDLPILMHQNHIRNANSPYNPALHHHGLTIEQIKYLPKILSDPAILFENPTDHAHPNRVVVVSDVLDNRGNPIIAVIQPDDKGRYNSIELPDVNYVTTMFGKNNAGNYIEKAAIDGRVLFWDKEKTQGLYREVQRQLPQALYNLEFNTIIRKSRAFVNTSAEKNQENSVNREEGHEQRRENSMSEFLIADQEKRAEEERNISREHEKEEFMTAWAATPEIERQAVKEELLYAERMGYIDDETNARERLAWVREFDFNRAREETLAGIQRAQTAAKERLNETAAQTVQNAPQKPEQTLGEELAGKTTWLKIELPKEAIGGKFGKNTLVHMPQGEYSHFGLFVDSKYLKENSNGKWTLAVGDKLNYHINNDGRQVELNGKELKDVLSGKALGRAPVRVAPSKRNKTALDRLAQNIPAELKALPCWGVYFTTPPKDPNKTKRDKVLLSPIDGHWSKANDPSKWTDFDTAMKYALENDKEGLTLLLTKESGYTCIDLDECIGADGKYNGVASKLTDELKGTYTERSVSGNGLHIFLKDDVLKDGKYKNTARTADGELEVYDSSHIISLTGDMVSKTNEITKCPTATALYLRENLGERQVAGASSSAPTNTNRGEYRAGTDDEVIGRIRKSKRGAEFDAIYSGKGLTGNASVDDMKLANILAFFTNCDEAQSLRIMRSSGSFRPDKSDDYYMHTIGKAVDTLFTRPTYGAVAGAEANKNPNGRDKD